MRRTRAVSLAVPAFFLSLAILLSAATSANAAGVSYAALGDSYSSGVGAGDYISDGSSCERSSNAYPYLWQQAKHPAQFAFAACSGARTGDVLNSQLSALNAGTSLVSITIGGNDAGFSTVMENCVLGSDGDCANAVDAAERYATTTLPGALGNLYAAMRAKAPHAHVVVLDYPHLYELDGSCLLGIGDDRRREVNDAADVLDGVIGKAAANAGFTFQEVRGLFQGHEICAWGDVWLHSTTYPVDESYHPTADGQAYGYLPGFSAGV